MVSPAGTGASRATASRRRVHTETKSALKTTELIIFILSVIAVLIAALVTDNGDDGQGFGAQQAWFYVTLLSVGYMVSRGLAKSGSRESYDDEASR